MSEGGGGGEVFHAGDISLENAASVLAAARAKIAAAEGDVVVDFQELHDCDSAAVCLLIEIFRAAAAKKRRVTARNVGEKLRKLLVFYQLSHLAGDAATAGGAAEESKSGE